MIMIMWLTVILLFISLFFLQTSHDLFVPETNLTLFAANITFPLLWGLSQ